MFRAVYNFGGVNRAALFAARMTVSAAVSSTDEHIRGNLAAMLGATVQTKRSSESDDLSLQVTLVAGACNKLYRQLCWAAA
jgi:hypothetical protein